MIPEISNRGSTHKGIVHAKCENDWNNIVKRKE